ncbi:hypothetical protein ACFLZH_00290 [Patescibacteria group bacterium]
MRLKIDLNAKPEYDFAYLDLHKKFDVPLHGQTPEQTRFFHYAFRNEINVFWRKCDMTGEKIISQFPQESPFKVYRHDLWWKEEFDVPEAEYNPDESFFKQFRKLQLQVPRMSIACDSTMENSPYVNCSNHCKDCYMIFASGDNEDCLYSINTERSKTCMDMSIAHECTLCYQIVSCRTCYNLDFSAYCTNCTDSQFLYDCRRCKNCFMCTGLVGKQYCVLNEQLTKEEYEKRIKELQPLTNETIEHCYEQLEKLRESYIHKYSNIVGCENCTGSDVSFSQNCLNSYIVEYSQDCMNSSSLRKCKNCLDFDLWGDPGELCYHSNSCGYNVYYIRMCFDCWNNCRYLTYCDSCPGCEHCFGCIGLKRKKFCILNKQYCEKDYKILVEQIIEDMKKRGEWGQFFPPYCSPHALNNSMAHEYFYVDQELAEKLGFEWMDKSAENEYAPDLIYNGSMISMDVKSDDLKGKFLLCKKTKRPYNIQARELAILKQKQLPLPDKHWKVRLEERAEKFIFPWRLSFRATQDTKKSLLSPVPEKYQIQEKEIA